MSYRKIIGYTLFYKQHKILKAGTFFKTCFVCKTFFVKRVVSLPNLNKSKGGVSFFIIPHIKFLMARQI